MLKIPPDGCGRITKLSGDVKNNSRTGGRNFPKDLQKNCPLT